MYPGTNDQGIKLPVLSKKTGIRDEKLLLDMNIQLREVDDRFDLSVRFEKLLQGLNNNQIADELKLTVSTVKSHLQEVYLKLNVPNRFVAIAQYRDLFEKFKKLSSEK